MQSENTSNTTYTKKSDKYANLSSSAFALLFVGILVLIVLILQTIGIINIPMLGKSNPLMTILLGFLGLICVMGGCISFYQASRLKAGIAKETEQTEHIFTEFLAKHSAEEIDEYVSVHTEDDNSSPEVLSIYRMETIKDFLCQEYPEIEIPYAEFLCEEIYQKLYENNTLKS